MSDFLEKKRYEGVRFNVISITRGLVGVQYPRKERYVTLEWTLIRNGLSMDRKCLATYVTVSIFKQYIML